MDQFELARQKTAQREARRARLSMPDIPPIPPIVIMGETKVPKEKPKKDGRFTVLVEMPHATFTFVITKPSILSNANLSRLTQSEIRKHIIDGLKPLLGGLE